MANRLVLFLGITGTGKRKALSCLQNAREAQEHGEIKIFDLEEDFIQGPQGIPIHSFLDQPSAKFQRSTWRAAMSSCRQQIEELRGECDIFLGLHAAILREEYGVRSVISLREIAELKPNTIVTLIDDLYSSWHRTETRGDERAEKGKPTLEHLLSGRRFEAFLGDFIAQQILDFSPSSPVTNYIMATRHTCDVLLRLLYHPSPKKVYVSFPISEPRRAQKGGDESGVQSINRFIEKLYDRQKRNPGMCFFIPLTVDELPLKFAAEDPSRREEVQRSGQAISMIRFKKRDRWALPYSESEMIHDGSDLPESILLPEWQVEEVKGAIKNDIRTRDFRYIDQSDVVAVFNPFFNQKRSRGVRAEMEYAIRTTKPVRVLQESKHASTEQQEELKGGKKKGDSPFTMDQRYLRIFIDQEDEFLRSLE